jgi:hypothetical protein
MNTLQIINIILNVVDSTNLDNLSFLAKTTFSTEYLNLAKNLHSHVMKIV